MAILNKIVNILILVLVIAAGVFSFLLFSKREMLMSGMKDMAKAINTAAVTLDDRGASGTKTGEQLSVASMDHKKQANFNKILPELNKSASEIIKQRNTLSNTIQSASEMLGNSRIKSASLKRVDNYEAECRNFRNTVAGYKQVSDGVKNMYVEMGRYIGANITFSQLNNGSTYRDAGNAVMAKVKAVQNGQNQVMGDLRRASQSFGVRANYSMNTAKFWHEAVNKVVTQHREIERERNKYKSVSVSQEKTIKQLNDTIASQKKTMDNLQERILFLEKIITDDGKKPMPAIHLKADSPECYTEVRGKIAYINEEYGFVQVNIGKEFVIVQEYGTKKNNVEFPLQPGLIMTVSRGISAGSKPIGKILVKQVNANSSICNIVKGSVSDFRVGDDVFFGSDDLSLIPAARFRDK